MLGRGLESLIPNSGDGGTNDGGMPHFRPSQVPPQSSPHSPQQFTPRHTPPPFTRAEPMHRDPISQSSVRYAEAPSRVPPPAREEGESIFHIELDKIAPNPYQPRREFNMDELEELAQSIREFGVLQPIIVSKVMREADTGAEVEYILIAGERRWRASKMARLERIPAIVKKVDASRSKLEMALIENVQRSNLNPLESAKAYARLQDEFGLTQREIAIRVGKSRESVANAMRLLNLPSQIQEALAQGKLPESQGRALLAVSDPHAQMKMFDEMLKKKSAPKGQKVNIAMVDDPQQKYWENQLEEKIGAPVKLKKQGTGGMISIQYYSTEELQGILQRLIGDDGL